MLYKLHKSELKSLTGMTTPRAGRRNARRTGRLFLKRNFNP